jgi:DNA-binding MarR family transcriptional regulator
MGTHTIAKSLGSPSAQKEIRSVLDSIRRIVRALRVSSRAAEKQAGLSGAQLFVLQKLAEVGRALSLNELAERTVTDQSSVSVIVQKLVKRGLVAVSRSKADGRRIEMVLTPPGRKVIGKSSGAAQERLIQALRTMPPAQRRQLASSLDRFVHETGIADAVPSLFFEHEHSPAHRTDSGKDKRNGKSR